MKETPPFLPKKYPDLPGSKPVERAVQKARREGEPIPDKRLARIQTYFDRLERVVDSEKGWRLLKQKLVKEFTLDTSREDTMNKISYALYNSEKQRAQEQGRTEELRQLEQEPPSQILKTRQPLIREKRALQEQTLNSWLNYLQENDAQYPIWFRYYATRNLQKMGALDKEKGEYAKRTKESLASFPELHEEALGKVYQWLTSGLGHLELTQPEDQEKRQQLLQLITQANFPQLYALAQLETAGKLNKESIKGKWIQYPQGSDHHQLEQSLQGKGTGWCTAAGSAYSHLQGGDFYVYYTQGTKGSYTEPRIAIRMQNNQVAEVRGVNLRQELEPALLDIAQAQYQTLPGGAKYDKKTQDMKQMTALTQKQEKGISLTQADLLFLYEVNSPIEGFGYQKDPRIKELRDQRNPDQDLPVIFDCELAQIAHNPEEINPNTKAYVGPLVNYGIPTLPLTKGPIIPIFDLLNQYQIEHIYTSFPEGRIRQETLQIGNQTKEALLQILAEQQTQEKLQISDNAQFMLKSEEFTVLPETEEAILIRLTVRDLFSDNEVHTTEQIYERAQKLGLELCPPEVGPQYRLQYQDQPFNEWIHVGMESIAGRDGGPGVFALGRFDAGLWLHVYWTVSASEWNPGYGFVFRLRPRARAKLGAGQAS